MRTIGIVTTSRAEYGVCRALLEKMRADPALDLRLIVSGTHLSQQHGHTIKQIQQDGYEIAEQIEVLLSSDTPQGISKSMGIAVMSFAQAFERFCPNILVVTGDRFEMHAAALAALPFKIPVAHVSGGELTEGAIDDALRHSLTKLSHLHFPATEEYGRRILQLGEEPWRVTVAGEPSLDQLATFRLLTREELEQRFSLQLDHPFLLVTYHPVTLEYEQAERQITELLAALKHCGIPTIFTLPNADTGSSIIREKIRTFAIENPSARVTENFGIHGYFSMMDLAAAMVGNSSSGIVEAASFELPVVNVGTRQDGRARARNVIDVGYSREEILCGIRKATSAEFRTSVSGLTNPYGTGHASQTIIDRLRTVELGDRLIRKKFYNVPIELERDAKTEGQAGHNKN